MPQQRKKEESEWLRGERDQFKFIDVGFERWQVARFRKARGRQDVPSARQLLSFWMLLSLLTCDVLFFNMLLLWIVKCVVC